jgi:hypothetical protein
MIVHSPGRRGSVSSYETESAGGGPVANDVALRDNRLSVIAHAVRPSSIWVARRRRSLMRPCYAQAADLGKKRADSQRVRDGLAQNIMLPGLPRTAGRLWSATQERPTRAIPATAAAR